MGPFSDTDSPAGLSPGVALLLAVATFCLCSLVFNVVIWLFFLVGLGALPRKLLLGASLFAFLLAAVMFARRIARAANRSRRYPKLVIVAAGAATALLYLACLRLGWDWITRWLFPHLPGTDLDFSGPTIAIVLGVATLLFGLSYVLAGVELEDAGMPEAAADLAGDLGGIVLEELGDQAGVEDEKQ